MRRKVEICGPQCACGAFPHLVNSLRKYGIEPAIKKPHPPQPDRDERVVIFETPANWSIRQLRELNIDLWNSPVAKLPYVRPPCFICFSRDWQAYKEYGCSFCGDSIIFCKECCESFRLGMEELPELNELLCHDCEDEELLDTDASPSLTALVWKEISREAEGITFDAIRERMKQICSFDKNADQKIDEAVFEAIKCEIVLSKGGKLFLNEEALE